MTGGICVPLEHDPVSDSGLVAWSFFPLRSFLGVFLAAMRFLLFLGRRCALTRRARWHKPSIHVIGNGEEKTTGAKGKVLAAPKAVT